MRKSFAFFAVSLAILAIGCSGGEQQASSTGTAPSGDMNAMKRDDPTQGQVPGGKGDFTTIKASLTNFCYPCHNGTNKKDDVDLENITAEDMKKHSANLIEVLEGKKMPPANHDKQPTDAERAEIVAGLKAL